MLPPLFPSVGRRFDSILDIPVRRCYHILREEDHSSIYNDKKCAAVTGRVKRETGESPVLSRNCK